VSKVKNEKKKDKQQFIKTRVRPNNSIEVEMRSPSKTLLGKIFIIIIVATMSLLGLVGLIFLMIQVGNSI